MIPLLCRLNTFALAIAGASILVMTLLGGADVVATAAAGRPVPAVFETTAALMVMVVFLGLGHLQLTGGNIAIDMLTARLSPAGRRLQAVIAQGIALAFFAALTWQAWDMAMQSWAIREYSMGLVPFPVYPGKFAVVLGAALTTLCSAAKLVDALRYGALPAEKRQPVE